MIEKYLTKVKYTKEFPDGSLKRTSEEYLIDAVSFGEAEERVYKEVGELVRGEFIVQAIAKQNYADIFMYDDSEKFYKITIKFVTDDADSGKEKKITNHYLIEASNTIEAEERLIECLKGILVTYEVTGKKLTKIVEIFEYEPLNKEE